MTALAPLVRSERLALIELLETLTPEEWAVPSLCEGWSVQDVAAHLAWTSAMSVGEMVSWLVRSGFSTNRMAADSAREWSRRGAAAIVERLREDAAKGLRPTGTTELMALTDAVTHAVDIRRPLGRSRPLDPQAFPLVADFFAGARWPLNIPLSGNPRRVVEGLRLVADDLGWRHGTGPEVHGPAEALLLVLTGRPVIPGELSGPGADTLYARL